MLMEMLEISWWICPTRVMQPFWSKYRCFERAHVTFQIYFKIMEMVTGEDFKMYLEDTMFYFHLSVLKSLQ